MLRNFALSLGMCATILATGQPQSPSPTCGNPYEIGMLVAASTEDLRQDRSKACTKKQLKQSGESNARLWARCDAFVGQHPNKFVTSTEFSETVKGCLTTAYRCESFCGTRKDRMKVIDDNVEKTLHP
jgi:hypothetical protein